jgi:FixJ family two-component response regulator
MASEKRRPEPHQPTRTRPAGTPPLSATGRREAANASARNAQATRKPMINAAVIAIVDDDPSVLRALHRLIQLNGYAVQSFASAQAFLDASPRCQPDCLVLDVHLNGSGFELQARLAADGMKIPIIFITAHNDDATRRRIEKSGAVAHLWKPVDRSTLLHAIRRAIGPDGHPERT